MADDGSEVLARCLVPLLWSASALSACAPTGGDVAGSRSALTVCAGQGTVQGIDVSYYQGVIDWGAVLGAGFRFAIARVSDGLAHPDGRFDDNWQQMESAGLLRGAYQYFEPSEDAASQAALVVQKVGRLGPLDLPVALDAETRSNLAPAELLAKYRVWLDAIEQGTGKRPLVYGAAYFWDALQGNELGDRPLWVANYDTSCPELPSRWGGWSFWQKGTDRVNGVGTTVDVDEFNGTLEELVTFANRKSGVNEGGDGAVPARETGSRGPLADRARADTGERSPASDGLDDAGEAGARWTSAPMGNATHDAPPRGAVDATVALPAIDGGDNATARSSGATGAARPASTCSIGSAPGLHGRTLRATSLAWLPLLFAAGARRLLRRFPSAGTPSPRHQRSGTTRAERARRRRRGEQFAEGEAAGG